MLTERNSALKGILDAALPALATREALATTEILHGIQQGTMVLLANPAHRGVNPTLIGQPAGIKINANIGTSPLINDETAEQEKLQLCEKYGAHTVMDLSTAGDLDTIRCRMLDSTHLPLGTVPIYAVAQRYLSRQRDPAEMSGDELLDEIARQAVQGVDFMTVHCGVTARAAALAGGDARVMGIVSRGGSLLARWMAKNHKENPLLERYDELLDIALAHNVVLSLGDGLRPGAGADAGDPAQWEEVVVLAELAARARAKGVQAMIEGPGHVPLHLVQSQIQGIKCLTRAPLYVLGPLTTDSAPGYDHIGAAIGGALAGLYGADFLCYVTPAEHLTLPTADDIRMGIMASRIAAQSAEVALRRPPALDRDLQLSLARKSLDWEAMAGLALDPDMVRQRRQAHAQERECAMCGKFCALRMLDADLS